MQNVFGKYLYVCMCACVCLHVLVQVLFQTCPGLLPGGWELGFVSDQQVSLVKYFSVVLQPPPVKLRGKRELETQKQRKKTAIFLAMFGTNVAMISLCLFFFLWFLFCLSHQCFDGFRLQDKMLLFLLSKEMHLLQHTCHTKPMPVPLKTKQSSQFSRCSFWGSL